MDVFGDPADRDPINAFVELLWKRGSAFEDEVIAELSVKLPFAVAQSSFCEMLFKRDSAAAVGG